MKTPVALIIFNRPDTTERVFAEIARAKPHKLFVIADGARDDHPRDAARCAATRSIVERVDWDCEVFKNYSDINLGCGKRPATGISWVFEHVEEAIILEDDCVPNPSFFRFCEELLERYRNDERVMTICGRNNFCKIHTSPYSYSFWYDVSNWGWATWRRAWKEYDFEIKLWRDLRNSTWLFEILGESGLVEYWRGIFDKVYEGKGNFNAWDYQWTFACWVKNSLAAVPNINLIGNIGFGEDATHTKSVNDRRRNVPTGEMLFPMKHPSDVVRDRDVDEFIFHHILQSKQRLGLYRRVRQKLFAIMPNLL